ncbi:metallophosphoesterase [Pseudomonas aeruginosa]|nr:metallophosphoesterase [Pseudomonas aeruginosa]
MKLHLLSDLHNEFRVYQPRRLDADVIVLAGDIDIKERAIDWATRAFDCPVLYVPGNHEFYKGQLGNSLAKLKALQTERIHILDCDEVVISGVRFLGATGWTDYGAYGDPAAATSAARAHMNDFSQIRTSGYQRTRPSDFADLAFRSYAWIEEKLAEPFAGPTVVITHHAPSLVSLKDDRHARGPLDAAYANSWEALIRPPVALWLHGHVHTATDYTLNDVRVVCNPRGYPGEHTRFDPELLLSID